MFGKNQNIAPDLFRNDVINRQGKLGDDACKVMTSALRAVDPYACVENYLQIKDSAILLGENPISFSEFDRLFIIGFGKASVPMARSVIDILGERVYSAAVVTKDKEFLNYDGYKTKLQVHLGGHPIPTDASLRATQSILRSIPDLTTRDIVIVLISGGGSALFTSPVNGVSLDDFQEMTELLLRSGAEIKEINTLRKHLDEVKGGRLALRLQPAQIHTLILSDVVGDRMDMIASGPTVPDPTYFEDALKIIDKYNLGNKLPQSIISYLELGANKDHPETLKKENTKDSCINHYLIGSNYHAAKAGYARARSLGYRSLILSTHLTGETENVVEFLDGIIKSEITHAVPLKAPVCLIFGGETTVQVTGSGLGGRNQDLALRIVEKIANISDLLFISLATDGEDGPTDAAGAVIDGRIFGEGADRQGLDIQSYIINNNSYVYLGKLGALIKTGSTGTNVNDLVIIMLKDS